MRWIIITSLLLATAASAQFANPPIGPGSSVQLGPSSQSGGVAPPACVPTGLDFTQQCNSQYVGTF